MENTEELLDEVVAQYRQWLVSAIEAAHDARSAASFTEAERELVKLAREMAAKLTQRVLQEVSDDEQRKQEALERVRAKAAARKVEVRSMGVRETLVRTLGGEVVRVRSPYAMAKVQGGTRQARGAQGTGVYPVLDELGIVGRSTPALRLWVSRTLCEANSVTSGRDLLSSSGLTIDHKAALRLTYLVTEDALQARAEAIAAQTEGTSGPLTGRRVVAAVDGGRLQVRRRLPGRPRKGGRKRFETEWREPKVLTIYALNDDGTRDRAVRSVIDATLGDADEVFALLRYHLLRLGAHEASELILVGDGAPWIWNRAEGLRKALDLPQECWHEVVDYFHVVERLGELSKTQLRWSEERRLEWLHEHKRLLKQGKIEAIEEAVRVIGMRPELDLESEAAYWARNRERMRYAALHEAGRPRGSGAVESSVRRVVNLRMKGASISWTERHAEGILHLRAHAKSGRWDEVEATVLNRTGWRPTSRRVLKAA